jgi:hypothetical protein
MTPREDTTAQERQEDKTRTRTHICYKKGYIYKTSQRKAPRTKARQDKASNAKPSRQGKSSKARQVKQRQPKPKPRQPIQAAKPSQAKPSQSQAKAKPSIAPAPRRARTSPFVGKFEYEAKQLLLHNHNPLALLVLCYIICLAANLHLRIGIACCLFIAYSSKHAATRRLQ